MLLQKATRPANDRTMAVACVAEVAKEIGSAITPYVEVGIGVCTCTCAANI